MKRCLLTLLACLLGTVLLGAAPPAPAFRAGAAMSNYSGPKKLDHERESNPW